MERAESEYVIITARKISLQFETGRHIIGAMQAINLNLGIHIDTI